MKDWYVDAIIESPSPTTAENLIAAGYSKVGTDSGFDIYALPDESVIFAVNEKDLR